MGYSPTATTATNSAIPTRKNRHGRGNYATQGGNSQKNDQLIKVEDSNLPTRGNRFVKTKQQSAKKEV